MAESEYLRGYRDGLAAAVERIQATPLMRPDQIRVELADKPVEPVDTRFTSRY